MKKGLCYKTQGLTKLMDTNHLHNIEEYLNTTINESYKEITTEEEAYNLFNNIITSFITNLSSEERIVLRLYTGYDFRGINSLLRGVWDNELNGDIDKTIKDKYQNLCNDLELIINKFPTLNLNFKVFRGVDLKPFYEYGIEKLEDLKYMKNQFYYESGFTSTSLLRDTSFYKKQSDNKTLCNIEIEYYIPKESSDGAMLLSDTLSISKEQNEYLINSGSLFKIIDVNINKEKNIAFLKAILIPKKIWSIINKKETIKR